MRLNKRVYVVDDDMQVRESLTFLLNAAGYLARPFDGGAAFLDDITTLQPGCIILDLRMPDMDGLEVMEKLGSGADLFPVILVTGHGDIVTAVRAMKLGARDYLEKPFVEELVLEALENAFDALGNGLTIREEHAAAAAQISKLSPREIDVLSGLVSGLSNKIIAYKLELSVRTVEMYRASMMDKLGVRSLSEALRLAYKVGLPETIFTTG